MIIAYDAKIDTLKTYAVCRTALKTEWKGTGSTPIRQRVFMTNIDNDMTTTVDSFYQKV